MPASRIVFIILGLALFCLGLYKLLDGLGVIGGNTSPAPVSGTASQTDLNMADSPTGPGYSTAAAVDQNWLRGDGNHRWQPACGPGVPYVFFGADSYLTQDNFGSYSLAGNVVRLQPRNGAQRVLYITRVDEDHMDVTSNGRTIRMNRCLSTGQL